MIWRFVHVAVGDGVAVAVRVAVAVGVFVAPGVVVAIGVLVTVAVGVAVADDAMVICAMNVPQSPADADALYSPATQITLLAAGSMAAPE